MQFKAEKYDDIVVGSGISGLTLALLLGLNGNKVLLLEKNPAIGGSLRRFYRRGIPFDTGFHFTGGFHKGEILYDMLKVLGIQDHIQPVFLSTEQASRIILEQANLVFDMPTGITNISDKLKKYFPGESGAIDRYFEMVKKVCEQTTTMDLNKIALSTQSLDEDFISLEEVLNRLTNNTFLKALLSVYCLCYGVKPKEISFANHCRVVFGLYESVTQVKNGGEAFIRAFQARFRELDIETKCNSFIAECADVQNDCVGRFILNTGEEITADRCTFTIHPEEVLKTLPRKHLSRAFVDRIQSFESSAGFFSLFGVVEDNNPEDDFRPQIISLLPKADLNELLDSKYSGPAALAIINNRGETENNSYKIMIAVEVSFPEHVCAWKDSKIGARPQGYKEYKEERVRSIVQRIKETFPEYKDTLKVLASASMLTFRDYLNSPDGSAYGIKQKIGQYNLFGKISLNNIYVAGQSSVLPGIVGAMMSSFVLGRNLVGKERYSRFIEERLSDLS